MATLLSEHFAYEELTTTQHRNLDNTPGPEEEANLKLLANETLEPVRELLGPMHVNSAYRSPEINKAVGGASTSQHVQGLACDFVPINHTFKEAVALILDPDNEIVFDQLIYEFGSWVHISHAPSTRPPRQQALMIGKWTEGKYLPYDASKIP